jgi:hypothetical protein
MINDLFSHINYSYLVFLGTFGLLLGILAFIIFIFRRIRYLLAKMMSREYSSPKLIASLKNLIFILLWSFLFGTILFMGFFFHAYHVFTHEKPVARIEITPTDKPQTMKIKLITFSDKDSASSEVYTIKGDQWLLEGDILKWDNWLNFLGLDTRYRLTRIRGRYLHTEAEINRETTVYSLVEDEDYPFWKYLYKYGEKLPFVSTVYGNAVFQYGNRYKKFLVFVTASGFIVRESLT